MNLYLKKDFRQITGSSNARSALCTLLNLSTEHTNGVITALEEDALPLCYFGNKLNIPVTIVLPNTTSSMKIRALKQYNAKLIIQGNNSQEAEEIAFRLAETNNKYLIKWYSNFIYIFKIYWRIFFICQINLINIKLN